MHNLQTQDVLIEGECCFQINDSDADMIKTEQTRQYDSGIGGPSGHGH
jgi:hypothetical protein